VEYLIGDETMKDARYDVRKHEKHDDIPNAECAYPVHSWHGVDLTDVRAQPAGDEYIRWILGTDVVLLSEWDGVPGPFWIIDDRDILDPWVYWGQALQPGEETSKFMEAVELIKQPNGDFYYAIHVELQALSIDELAGDAPEWTDAPAEIIESIVGSSASVQLLWPAGVTPPFTLGRGARQAGPDVRVLPDSANQSVVWRSSNPGAVAVNAATGEINVVGTSGIAFIIAENAATGKSASYRVTIAGTTPIIALRDLIAEFDGLDPADYTAGSYASVKAVVDAARPVAADDEATEAAILAEIAKIEAVFPSALVRSTLEVLPPLAPGNATKGYVPRDENVYVGGVPTPMYYPEKDGRVNIMGLGTATMALDHHYYEPPYMYDSYGFIYLDTILKDYEEGSYGEYGISNVAATDMDPGSASNTGASALAFGERNGRDVLLIRYVPSRAEVIAQIAASGVAGYSPEVPITFRLSRGDASAEIKITAVYFANNV
jgi:hypothetical protein